MMDARAIVKSLGGMWCGSYGLARCPVHSDGKPSLKIKDDPNKKDKIDLICFAGCDWRTIKAEFARQGLIEAWSAKTGSKRSRPKPSARSARPPLSEQQRTQIALRIWSQSVPLPGTLGWRYFTERRQLHIGLLDDLSHVLRWSAAEHAVLGLMTDVITGKPMGVHRTFLNPYGTKRERKMLGLRGVIRLSPDENVLEGLGLTEGAEDGLAMLLDGWAPIWAATCANAIASFPVLSGIGALSVFSDSDDAGVRAAEACAGRWRAEGRDVDS